MLTCLRAGGAAFGQAVVELTIHKAVDGSHAQVLALCPFISQRTVQSVLGVAIFVRVVAEGQRVGCVETIAGAVAGSQAVVPALGRT